MTETYSHWSVPVIVEDIPDSGLHVEIEAPAAARAAVAALASVRDLPELSAVFDLTRQGAGVHVAGQVKARVCQTCVVSLEPMESDVDEAVDLRFLPGVGVGPPESGRKRSLGGEEPPEPLVDGKVDLGALATEFLILGIDPYPRKPGVEFAPPPIEDAGEHPFSALKTLKKSLGGGES